MPEALIRESEINISLLKVISYFTNVRHNFSVSGVATGFSAYKMRILRVLLGNRIVKLGLPVYGVQLRSRELHAALRGAVRGCEASDDYVS